MNEKEKRRVGMMEDLESVKEEINSLFGTPKPNPIKEPEKYKEPKKTVFSHKSQSIEAQKFSSGRVEFTSHKIEAEPENNFVIRSSRNKKADEEARKRAEE